jgi:hypothetical protein
MNGLIHWWIKNVNMLLDGGIVEEFRSSWRRRKWVTGDMSLKGIS